MKTNQVIRIGKNVFLTGLAALVPSICSAVDFVDNFDTNFVGSPPGGWTVGVQSGGGSGNVDNSQSVSANNSVALYTSSNFTFGSTYMYRTDLVNTPTGPFAYFSNDYVYTSVRLTSTNGFLNLGVVDTGLTAAFAVRFNQGQIEAYNGATLNALGTYTSDTWYRVEMMTKPATTKYSFTVYDPSDAVVASAVNYDYNILTSPQGLFYIQYGTVSGSPVGTTAYIDNVFVGIPEPSNLALLVIGGLSVLGIRRRI
jgi:hypothetical protein